MTKFNFKKSVPCDNLSTKHIQEKQYDYPMGYRTKNSDDLPFLIGIFIILLVFIIMWIFIIYFSLTSLWLSL